MPRKHANPSLLEDSGLLLLLVLAHCGFLFAMKSSRWSAKCKLICFDMFEVDCLVTLQDLGLQPWENSVLGGFQYPDLMCMIKLALSLTLAQLNTMSY